MCPLVLWPVQVVQLSTANATKETGGAFIVMSAVNVATAGNPDGQLAVLGASPRSAAVAASQEAAAPGEPA